MRLGASPIEMPDTTVTDKSADADSQKRQQALEALNAKLTGVPAPAKAPETSEEDGKVAATAPLKGKVMVEWEPGVTREVDVEELVNSAKTKADIESAKRLFQKQALEDSITARLEAMDPEERKIVEQALSNPKAFLSKPIEEGDDLDEILGDQPRQPNGQYVSKKEYDEMRQVVEAIGQHIYGELQERAKSTMADRVDEMMAPFKDAFPKGSELTSWAKDSIITQITLDPKQDLEQLVTTTARRAIKMRGVDREILARAETATAKTPSAKPLPDLTADDLASGGSLTRLQQFLAERAKQG